jgi:hypothetical protein
VRNKRKWRIIKPEKNGLVCSSDPENSFSILVSACFDDVIEQTENLSALFVIIQPTAGKENVLPHQG